ncbi:hypothetical protein SAMD00019534_094630 [Acytostelium subglobosum LB1]|uniref:hypothetical protein n=1 Tax=Acytostelium subglobosum LB1 TaxID=1410327 RepID=UPI000644F8FF|nr:hypothetical protein SAMD00019534_094630 [Acytostelium subglobosum LB1]GAM26288.1 hypothetical protein SAMD00019534_094630 [Acytostelium subglobosum LB1]|eukprot:XP_012750842.1 hypothetical protein SAMD00019534_094630 [Acytostelium subglobosum LB1]
MACTNVTMALRSYRSLVGSHPVSSELNLLVVPGVHTPDAHKDQLGFSPICLNVTIGPTVISDTDPLVFDYSSNSNHMTMINAQVLSINNKVTMVLNDVIMTCAYLPNMPPLLEMRPNEMEADQYGARTLIINGGAVVNCTLRDTYLIIVDGANLVIDNFQVSNNNANNMLQILKSVTTITNTLFHNNWVDYIMFVLDNTLETVFSNCTFSQNHMSTVTGLTMIQHAIGPLTITDSVFEGNYNLTILIDVSDGEVSIQDTTFINNNVIGGPLLQVSSSTFNMTNVTLTSDQYEQVQYIVEFQSTKVSLTNVVFDDQPYVVKDVIACYEGDITFNNVTNNVGGSGLIDCKYPGLCTIQGDQPNICPQQH